MFRPDITEMVEWALTTNYLPIQGWIAPQRHSRFTIISKVAESPSLSCNSAPEEEDEMNVPMTLGVFRTKPQTLTDVPDWVTTPAVQPHLVGIVTVLIFSAMVASWHPTGVTLAEGRSGTLSCNPSLAAQLSVLILTRMFSSVQFKIYLQCYTLS